MDATNELENHYDGINCSSDERASFSDPLIDHGGTREGAYWNYGIENCTELIYSIMPGSRTYLIDIDNDELIFFNAETYAWMWETHDGSHTHSGNGCVYTQGDARASFRNICTVKTWSVWNKDNTNGSRSFKSLTNRYVSENHLIIYDVQTTTTGCTTKNVDRLACSFDVAYLSDGEVLQHPAHCKRTAPS